MWGARVETGHTSTPCPNNDQNPYFIECDPKYFNYILYFLRFGESSTINILAKLSEIEVEQVRNVAKILGIYSSMFEKFDGFISVKVTFVWNDNTPHNDLIVSKLLPSDLIASKRNIFFRFGLDFTNLDSCMCYFAIVNDYESRKWDTKNIIDHDDNVIAKYGYSFINENQKQNEEEQFANEVITHEMNVVLYFRVWIEFSNGLLGFDRIVRDDNGTEKRIDTITMPFKYSKNFAESLRFCIAIESFSVLRALFNCCWYSVNRVLFVGDASASRTL